MRFRIHPLFFALALVLVLLGQALSFFWAFAAVCLHELGHAAAARARGYVVKSMTLLPFGAVMSSEEEFDRASGVIIGAAGPLFNLLLALVTLGVWWLFPAVYPYSAPFLFANLSIAVFNLLPVYPLDGSRVVLSLAKNRLKALKGLQIAGVTVSLILFALFIVSAFFAINFTLGILAVFLFFGATSAANEEMYSSVMSASSKKYSVGVVKKSVTVSGSVPIVRLFHHISSTTETVFTVVDDSDGGRRTLFTLDEQQLKALALNAKLSTPLAAAKERADKRGIAGHISTLP